MAQRRKISGARAGTESAAGGETAGAEAGERADPSPPARWWPAPCWGRAAPLPTRLLVRSGELFGISPGYHPGGAVADGGRRGAGGGRQRPRPGRAAARSTGPPAGQPGARRRRWTGEWTMAVVIETRRPVSARAELRARHGRAAPGRVARGRLAATGQPGRERADRPGPCWPPSAGGSWAARIRPTGPMSSWPAGCGISTPGTPGPAGCAGDWPRWWGVWRRATPPPWPPGSCCRPRCCATCWPIPCSRRSCWDPTGRATTCGPTTTATTGPSRSLWRDWFRREADH